MDMQEEKKRLLDEWGRLVVENAHSGALMGGNPEKKIPIIECAKVNGPRAGALELYAGLRSGDLLSVLSKNDCAMLRQLIPWQFQGEPACFMSGRFVRIEAGWADLLAEKDVRLSDLGQWPKGGGRWIAGKDELGCTVTLGLDDVQLKAHFLFAGTTGSGKSWAMRAAASQLCHDPQNRLILIDGKFGEGLGPLAHIQNLAGPLVRDVEDARAALSYAVGVMRKRYERMNGEGRLIIFVDEVQELCKDRVVTEFLRMLVSQGRAARVHCILGTQHPTVAMFGGDPTIKRNLPGRLALRVLDAKSSEIAIGASTPRADHLLGAGDAYAIVPGRALRTQLAYIPPKDFANVPAGEPMLDEWPTYDPEAAGTLSEEDTVNWAYGGDELGAAVWQASLGNGRRRMVGAMQDEGFDICEGDRAKRLSALGKEAYAWLHKKKGLTLCQNGAGRVGGLVVEDTPSDAWESFFERVSVG
jgi:hypothetical protein